MWKRNKPGCCITSPNAYKAHREGEAIPGALSSWIVCTLRADCRTNGGCSRIVVTLIHVMAGTPEHEQRRHGWLVIAVVRQSHMDESLFENEILAGQSA